MPRPRKFDDEAVLDAAVECFWSHGLDGASVRELGARMGLNAPSIYNAFGDKRHLFILALDRYAAKAMRERLARLSSLASPSQALRTFFCETIDRSLGDAERRGCFIINTALEVAPHDAEIGRMVAQHLSEIEGFMRDRTLAARELGEIPASIDVNDTGRLLLGLLVAVRVLTRTGAGREQLEGMVRPALAVFPQ